MIIGRFKVRCRPERATEIAEAIAAAEAPSRGLYRRRPFRCRPEPDRPEQLHRLRDLRRPRRAGTPNTLREVAHVLQLVNTGGLTGEYEWTVLETEAVPASR
jgi:hypothetical protein